MLDRATTYIICALIAAIALPLALQWIGPNAYYGFRTAATLSNSALWYRINAVAGWSMIASMAAIALILSLLPEPLLVDYPCIPLGVMLLGIVAVLVGTYLSLPAAH